MFYSTKLLLLPLLPPLAALVHGCQWRRSQPGEGMKRRGGIHAVVAKTHKHSIRTAAATSGNCIWSKTCRYRTTMLGKICVNNKMKPSPSQGGKTHANANEHEARAKKSWTSYRTRFTLCTPSGTPVLSMLILNEETKKIHNLGQITICRSSMYYCKARRLFAVLRGCAGSAYQ